IPRGDAHRLVAAGPGGKPPNRGGGETQWGGGARTLAHAHATRAAGHELGRISGISSHDAHFSVTDDERFRCRPRFARLPQQAAQSWRNIHTLMDSTVATMGRV